MRTPEAIYERLTNGDSLTDQDVIAGSKFFGDITAKLAQAGPVFRLPFVEANQVTTKLREYGYARGIISYDKNGKVLYQKRTK